MERANYEIQDGGVLASVCNKYTATDSVPGVSAEAARNLTNDLEDATVKDVAQQRAVVYEQSCTIEQNEVLDRCNDLIASFHHAVLSEFGAADKVTMRKFHIGPKVPTSVSGIKSELKYLSGTVPEYAALLKKHGISDADITDLDALHDELSQADMVQENAKAAKKAATSARDLAIKKLIRTKQSIRHDVQVVFRKQPPVLIEFEKLPLPPPGRKPNEENTPPAK